MKHPHTRTGRSLVGLTLVLLGLSTYGCGDSATVTEPASLGGLSASVGILEPKFNPATTNYTVKLFGSESSTTISASPRVAGDTIRINNIQTTSQTVTIPAIGASELLNIVVTETGTGGTSKSYSVRVSREEEDTTLRDLSSPQGTVTPSPFDKSELAPSITGVGNGVTSITLTATKSDPNTEMVIDIPTTPVTVPAGTASGEATVQLGGPGSDTKVPIIITGPKGGKTTYQVTIKRGASDNALLRSLSISPGRLTFRSSTTLYDVSVGSDIKEVTVTGKPQDANASLKILVNGVEDPQPPIELLGPGQTTSITVHVTAQDGKSQQNYVIRVKRASPNGNNDLKSLTVSQGSLDTRFDPKDQQYNVSLLSSVTSLRITADPQDSTARVAINGKPSPADIDLGATGPRALITVSIVVTADNNDTKAYNVTLDRAALGGNFNLSSLTVTGHTLSRQSETRYTLEVENNVDRVTVNATPQDSGARLRFLVGNVVQPTKSISLPPGPSTTEIEIEVTAQNGSPKSYFITVTRLAPSGNANLSALSVTAGSTVTRFSPPFGSNEVTVTPEVERVLVRATKDDENATMAIGSKTIPQGTPSGEDTFTLNGAGGAPTTISFTVTAQNGVTVKTHTISVIRPAAPTPPAKPAIAPDLLTADDSCPLRTDLTGPPSGTNADCAVDDQGIPFGTRDDNFTTVTTPRFTIPQPASGHTPNLYVDGNKVGSNFNAANNTLQPTTPLSGNNNGIPHSITSTVTNTATNLESQQSDPLPVTISTGQTGT